MKKNRIMYIVTILISFFLFLWSSKKYMLCIALLGCIYPIIAYVVLKIESKFIEINLDIRTACIAGNPAELKVIIDSKRVSLASSSIILNLECENIKFIEKEISEFVFTTDKNREEFELKFVPKYSGITYISSKKAILTDLFMILGISLKKIRTEKIVVYPTNILFSVEKNIPEISNNNRDNNEINKKGNDYSEIFDMREYVPGDDVRLVHWKLTGKLDRVILKEGCKSATLDTLVVFDLGIMLNGENANKEVISKCFDVGLSICERLISQNMPYVISFMYDNEMHRRVIDSINKYIDFVEEFLAIPIHDEIGEVLNFLANAEYRVEFTKVIYISANAFDNRLSDISRYINVTAISVNEDIEKLQMNRNEHYEIIEMPYKNYENTINSIHI